MKICIIGAGFTGLTAGLRLSKLGHNVVLFEKEGSLGGLATGFKEKRWEWSLERAYHHWFTNDTFVLNLASELDHPVTIKRPRTDVFVKGKRYQFDSPLSLLTFPHLPLIDRVRTGFAALLLKATNDANMLEGKRAYPWIRKWMGEKSFELIWDPLFTGKFGGHKEEVALTWFWARIKKRTAKLAYPEGGFQDFAQRIAEEIEKLGGIILLETRVTKIKSSGRGVSVDGESFDKVIVTLPTPIFVSITEELPRNYVERISKVDHLHALNLVLVLTKPFMEDTYWLNITDEIFPFLVVVEHTNFMDPKHYGNQHILYVGNYLPKEHRYFKMNKDELLKEFDPFLKKINPLYHSSLITHHSFIGPFAQPIVTVDYVKYLPTFETPLQNIFLANLDMVYPWDRGTNYAIELGEKVAKHTIR